MTALDEIQKASRELTTLLSREQALSREELFEALKKYREALHVFVVGVHTLYDSAVLVTSNFSSPRLAAAAWKDLHENFFAVLEVLGRLPMLEPRTNRVIVSSIKDVRFILNLADQKYRTYTELAEAQVELDDCDAIAREGFAMLDTEESRLER